MSASPTVLIVEDHTLLAEGLAAAFRAEGLVVHVVDGPSSDVIIAVAREVEPDLVLLDLMLGDEIGLTIPMIPGLRSTGADVLVLTGITDRLLLSASLEAGASGFASKSATFDGILDRVRNTLDGQPAISEPERADMLADLREHRAERQARIAPFERLTARERAVLAALMDGCPAERIAEESFVSIATVRSQIRSILEKLDVRSQLAGWRWRTAWSGRPRWARRVPSRFRSGRADLRRPGCSAGPAARRGFVAGVEEATEAEGQASATDAPVQPVAQPFEHGDLRVEAGAPGAREALPVLGRGRPVLGERLQGGPHLRQAQADLLRDADERDPADRVA